MIPSTTPDLPRIPPLADDQCLCLVGMAGAGKSTLGRVLSGRLGWVHLDTDRLVEAWWGQSLQSLLDERGPQGFLAAEEEVVAGLGLKRAVVSTGGSVVYLERAMHHLKSLGPMVWLRITRDTFLQRVGQADGRGFVRRDNVASLEDVYAERQPLYRQAADMVVDTDDISPEAVAEIILARLRKAPAASRP